MLCPEKFINLAKMINADGIRLFNDKYTLCCNNEKKKKKEHARTYYIGNFQMSWSRARTGPHHSFSVRYNKEVVV